jgi:hypothetical protein
MFEDKLLDLGSLLEAAIVLFNDSILDASFVIAIIISKL